VGASNEGVHTVEFVRTRHKVISCTERSILTVSFNGQQ